MITDKSEFQSKAFKYLCEYAAKYNEFLIEDVGEYAYANGLDEPLETRWWGPVATIARSKGIIESTGTFRMCSKGKGNPRYMMIWKSNKV